MDQMGCIVSKSDIVETSHNKLCDVTLEDTIEYYPPITGGKADKVFQATWMSLSDEC